MTDIKEAVENFRSTALPFRAMLDLLDVLEEAGDLLRASSEAKSQMLAAQSEKERIASEATALSESAKDIIAQAQSQADDITKKASDLAVAYVTDAKTQAKEILDTVTSQKAAILDEVASAVSTRDTAFSDRNAATKDLDSILTKIQQAKDKFQTLVASVV